MLGHRGHQDGFSSDARRCGSIYTFLDLGRSTHAPASRDGYFWGTRKQDFMMDKEETRRRQGESQGRPSGDRKLGTARSWNFASAAFPGVWSVLWLARFWPPWCHGSGLSAFAGRGSSFSLLFALLPFCSLEW